MGVGVSGKDSMMSAGVGTVVVMVGVMQARSWSDVQVSTDLACSTNEGLETQCESKGAS